jgi:hypothetical protein
VSNTRMGVLITLVGVSNTRAGVSDTPRLDDLSCQASSSSHLQYSR